MSKFRLVTAFSIPALLLGSVATAAPRDIQISEINLDTGVMTLHNYGPIDQVMNGFRFCTQDDNETLRYTAASGFNGINIQTGAELDIHLFNDAVAGPGVINLSTLAGVFAGPLDTGPFSIALYFPPAVFADGNLMADFIQWNIGGADNTIADERSDEAQAGGVWTDQSAWVSTTANTETITLKAASAGLILHGPTDYETTEAPGIPGDINGDGVVDTADLGILIGVFGTNTPGADINGDMIVDTADLGILIGNFGSEG
jgi:hypothetical protein